MVKRLSTMREILIRAVGWEDPLKKEMAIHSSTIAWRIPWTEEPGRLQGCKESDTTERLRSVKDYLDTNVSKRAFKKSMISKAASPTHYYVMKSIMTKLFFK